MTFKYTSLDKATVAAQGYKITCYNYRNPITVGESGDFKITVQYNSPGTTTPFKVFEHPTFKLTVATTGTNAISPVTVATDKFTIGFIK